MRKMTGKHHHQIMIYMLDGLKYQALFECSKDPIQNFKKIYTIRPSNLWLMPILILNSMVISHL